MKISEPFYLEGGVTDYWGRADSSVARGSGSLCPNTLGPVLWHAPLAPCQQTIPKANTAKAFSAQAGPHKRPEKDLDCRGATRKQDVGKPNRPYKALDMVSLVNLTGVRCSLRGVKVKANLMSAGANTDQSCISRWKTSERLNRRKIWGELNKPVFRSAKCI